MSLQRYNSLKKRAARQGIDVPRGTDLATLERMLGASSSSKRTRRKRKRGGSCDCACGCRHCAAVSYWPWC